METVYIQKQQGPEGQVRYTVSAVRIQGPEGKNRGVPHPYGKESSSYPALEPAIEAIHRAGYDAEFEGRYYPMPPHQSANRKPKTTKALPPRPGTLAQTLALSKKPLQALLNDTNPGVVSNAAYALGELRDESAVGALITVFRHDDATVRKQAAEATAKIGEAALRPLESALRDPHWLVRHSAATALVELVSQRFDLVAQILPAALPLLEDENWLVRSQTALALAEAARMQAHLDASNA